jgi:hypothetical protein
LEIELLNSFSISISEGRRVRRTGKDLKTEFVTDGERLVSYKRPEVVFRLLTGSGGMCVEKRQQRSQARERERDE